MSDDEKTSRGRSLVGRHPKMSLAIAVLLGVAVGAWVRPAPNAAPVAAAGDEHAGHEESTKWTCSMHPQIQRDGPGKCPLCGMDLIPVKQTAPAGSVRALSVTPEARALMNIETAPVERKFVTADVRMVGKVQYDETRLSYIAARVAGRLDRLYVDYTGVEVKKGDHMYSIYSPELYYAQEELIQAARSARARGSVSEIGGINVVEAAREKLRLIGLTDEQIAQIEAQQQPTDHLTFYSPMNGIVIEKLRQEGDYVQTGERIYTLADLAQVWVMLDAYESDLPWIRYGQEVTFTTEAYPGESFVGRISFIQPVLDDRTRTVKVRVNVPNPEGKLKPEMFVRGEVRAQVAEGGQVVAPDLAGKWISPMHPWIVKDGPGTCDVCGMKLVPAEELGYVSAETVAREAPLVIPRSAALVTGPRAVVYVEVPDQEEPTYEGREIVLGPRAGDYYLVREGLQEGELVVTNGAFKIDSEIQIQAKPSMMMPAGGAHGGASGHQH